MGDIKSMAGNTNKGENAMAQQNLSKMAEMVEKLAPQLDELVDQMVEAAVEEVLDELSEWMVTDLLAKVAERLENRKRL